MGKKIAVLLCGSGFLDGSEIRESVAVLWALSSAGVEVQCFAPNDKQFDVMNCLTKEASQETRNMLTESARIARSQVKAISEFQIGDFAGLAIPGGYGVAKNLCSFAMDGAKGKVRLEVKQAVLDCFQAKKPLLAVCIAPALVALAAQGTLKLKLTVGEAGEAAQEIEKLGHSHSVKKVTEFEADSQNKFVTTPAYMYGDAKLADIFTGIQAATRAFLALA